MWRLGEGPGVQGQIWGSFGKVIVVPGEGLVPEIRNVETWGVGDIHWGC